MGARRDDRPAVQDVGVWGGMSEDGRRALKRRAARNRARAAG